MVIVELTPGYAVAVIGNQLWYLSARLAVRLLAGSVAVRFRRFAPVITTQLTVFNHH